MITSRSNGTLIVLIVIVLTTLAPAYAGTHDHSVRVRTADLDLSSADGQDELQARIQDAAGRLCRRIGAGGWRHFYCSRQIRQSAAPDYARAVARAAVRDDL
jgi:UrcA family protein